MSDSAGYHVYIKNLTHYYKELKVLHSLNLEVSCGEILVLLGPNGAGKTTLIQLLCRLIGVQQGAISYKDNNVELTRRKQIVTSIGYVPQSHINLPELTCYEHLAFLCRMYKIKKTAVIDKLLNDFGLLEKKHTRSYKLSGGMKRKLDCAMALVHDPPFLIFDESESGLDIDSRLHLRKLMRQLAEQKNKTIVYATHDIEEAEKLAHRVVILDQGKLLLNEPADQIKKRLKKKTKISMQMPQNYTISTEERQSLSNITKEFDCSNHQLNAIIENDRNRIQRFMQAVIPEPVSISVTTPSLEDLFIELTGRSIHQ